MKPIVVHMANATLLRRAPRIAAKLVAAGAIGWGLGVISAGYLILWRAM